MGSATSGNRNRHSERPRVGQLPSIDVRKLAKSRGLRLGDRFTVLSRPPGSNLPALHARVRDKSIVFEFASETYDADPIRDQWSVSIHESWCHFGGRRYWFQCPMPRCERRVAILYVGRHCIACRYCLRMLYPSQFYDHTQRAFSRLRRINERIYADTVSLTKAKPKGMHAKTFSRLLSEQESARTRLLAHVDRLFGSGLLADEIDPETAC